MARKAQAPRNDHVMMRLFQLGTQYYVAGRFLTLAQTIPVAGNLLHHAIEMCLKGALARSHTTEQLTHYRHNLNRLWRRFKDQFRDPSLRSFDGVVAGLHRFERIRYPDAMITEGAEIQFALYKGHIVRPSSRQKNSVPAYELTLEEIDQLMFRIFEKARINPSFYFGRLHEHALLFSNRHNKHLPQTAN